MGLPQASFFLDIYVSIKMAESIARRETEKAEKLHKCLNGTKLTIFISVIVSMVVLFAMQIIELVNYTNDQQDKNTTFKYLDIGIVVAMSLVWIVLLVSIILLMTKTEVFLGNKFSSEKCEIYTMFVTLTIGYTCAIIINSLIIEPHSKHLNRF